jgi:hypothetical protein
VPRGIAKSELPGIFRKLEFDRRARLAQHHRLDAKRRGFLPHRSISSPTPSTEPSFSCRRGTTYLRSWRAIGKEMHLAPRGYIRVETGYGFLEEIPDDLLINAADEVRIRQDLVLTALGRRPADRAL